MLLWWKMQTIHNLRVCAHSPRHLSAFMRYGTTWPDLEKNKSEIRDSNRRDRLPQVLIVSCFDKLKGSRTSNSRGIFSSLPNANWKIATWCLRC